MYLSIPFLWNGTLRINLNFFFFFEVSEMGLFFNEKRVNSQVQNKLKECLGAKNAYENDANTLRIISKLKFNASMNFFVKWTTCPTGCAKINVRLLFPAIPWHGWYHCKMQQTFIRMYLNQDRGEMQYKDVCICLCISYFNYKFECYIKRLWTRRLDYQVMVIHRTYDPLVSPLIHKITHLL